MPKKKTHEEYVAEVNKINPNIEVVGTYLDSKTKILHRCKIDGYEWYATPHNILRGRGCPKCSGHIKLTHDEYVNRLFNINPNISVLEQYVNYATPIKHCCLIHNYEWYALPSNVLSGHGCKKCASDKLANDRSKNTLQYIEDVKNVNKDIMVIGEYVNAHTPILHKCLIDGYEWYAKPNNILSQKGCPKCSGTMKKMHDEYIDEVSIYNPDIEVVETYINAKTKILHKCKICGCEWYATPTNILTGKGCPECAESNGERTVRQYLDKHKILYNFQKAFDDCCDIKHLPFDFYLPEYNACIEYDGEQHYRPVDYFGGEDSFKKTVMHDNIKNDYCKNNDIKLLRIPYYANVEEELNNFLFI